MLNTIDWILIGIAVATAAIALLLLFTQARSRDVERLHALRLLAEDGQRQSTLWLATLEQSAESASALSAQIKTHANTIEQQYQRCQAHVEKTQALLELAYKTERGLQQLSQTLEERFDTEPQEPSKTPTADNTVPPIKAIRKHLKEHLIAVETGLEQAKEQEYTVQQLVQNYQDSPTKLTTNTPSPNELKQHLTLLVNESTASLDNRPEHQNNPSSQHFAEELALIEQQVKEHFSELHDITEQARQEVKASLDEARYHLKTLQQREKQNQTNTIEPPAQPRLTSLVSLGNSMRPVSEPLLYTKAPHQPEKEALPKTLFAIRGSKS